MSTTFMAKYFNDFVVDQSPDMLSFYTRMYGVVWGVMGIASFKYCTSFGITFYNLVGQFMNLAHFLALLFGNLYVEKMYVDQKQMWQIQVGINLLFVIIAYLGFKDASESGNAKSDATHNAGETGHKVIGGFNLHQTNCNKFLGIAWGFYGACMLFVPEQFMAQYWSEAGTNFKLFLFLARGMGLMFLTLSASSFLHPGSDGLSAGNLLLQALMLIHFLAIVFGNIYEASLWEEKKNMWYAQIALGVGFFTVAYLGYKDSVARAPAAASTSATAATTASTGATASTPAGGSML
jgi:hypothetical protein